MPKHLPDYTKFGFVYSCWGAPSPDPARYWHLWNTLTFAKRFECAILPLCSQFVVDPKVFGFSTASTSYSTVHIYSKKDLDRGVKYPRDTMSHVCLACQKAAENK